jgi:hypothetical protein
MQKNNLESSDSADQKSTVGMNETSSDWEFSGVTLFRALGYVVGLLSFMIGTAIFMLGFSLSSTVLVQTASVLYSLAIASLLGRVVIERVNPRNEMQAAGVAVMMFVLAGCVYAALTFLIWILELI